MNPYHDQEVHRLVKRVMFLCIAFFMGILLVNGGMLTLTKNNMVRQQGKIVSGLLQEGVSAEQIAKAYSNTNVSLQGEELLKKMGYDGRHSLFLYEDYCLSSWLLMFAFCLLGMGFALLFLRELFWFIRQRNLVYENAGKIVDAYRKGDYSKRLSTEEEGGLSALFSSVYLLATQLKAGKEEMEKEKDFLKQMISDISHQLKTSIAAISMYQEIITEEKEHPDTVLSFCEKTKSSVKRMEELVYSLLKITRMDAGTITFSREEVKLSVLAEEIFEDYQERAKKEGKELQSKGNSQVSLYCDRLWMREAVGNLIKNALDHTGNGQTVLFSWEQTPMMVRLQVTDNGTGIAPEDIHHIFKRFYRSRNSSDRQGVGLGLSLTKAIVEGMGGTISVESRVGEGTVFTITFLVDL